MSMNNEAIMKKLKQDFVKNGNLKDLSDICIGELADWFIVGVKLNDMEITSFCLYTIRA